MNLDQFTQRIHDVTDERKESYGEADKMFADIAAVWSVLYGVKITPRRAALGLAALKLLRENYSHSDDNVVDLAAYAYFSGGLE